MRLFAYVQSGLLLVFFVFPFVGGLYYSVCGDHHYEQQYVDSCIEHLKLLRANTDDPDLQGVLDYTIRRYSKVGAWDVMFMPLESDVRPGKTVGCNCPWCPGITLDPCLLCLPPEETAIVIAHEAMHDYFPYFGHAHVTPRETKFYELSYALSRNGRAKND